MTKHTQQIRLSPDKKIGGWVIHKPGAERAIARTETKLEGLTKINQIAKNQQLETKIQKMDGTIEGGNSYGKDPFPPKG